MSKSSKFSQTWRNKIRLLVHSNRKSMRIGRGIKRGGRRSLASYGRMGVVRSAGRPKSKTVLHFPPPKQSTLPSLELFKKAFGCGIPWVRLVHRILRPSSSPPTITGLFHWHPTTPRMERQNTSTFVTTSFGHTLSTGSSTSFTLRGLSTRPISSQSRLLASNFKNMSRGLAWALAEGVC